MRYQAVLDKLLHMSSLRNAAGLLFAALLPSLPLVGQTLTPSLALVDNTTWCATNNCLTPIPGTPSTLTEIKVGGDGTIYSLDGAVPYTFAAGAWSKVSSALQSAGGYPIIHLSVARASKVLAVNAAPSPTPNVYVLDSAGTAWQQLPTGWMSTAEIGSDGTVWGIGPSPTYEAYSWNGSAWVDEGLELSSLAVASAGEIMAVGAGGLLRGWSGNWDTLSPGFNPSKAIDGIALVGQSLALLDLNGGIHISTNEGESWSTISGTASAITGGNPFLFTRNGNSAYHVNLTVPALTATGRIAAECFVATPQEGVPTKYCANESIVAGAVFGGVGGAHGTTGVTVSSFGTEPAALIAAATGQGTTCDPLYDPSSANCEPTTSGDGDWGCGLEENEGGDPIEYCLDTFPPLGFSVDIETAFTQAYWKARHRLHATSTRCVPTQSRTTVRQPPRPRI